jgi:hypothetical protein
MVAQNAINSEDQHYGYEIRNGEIYGPSGGRESVRFPTGIAGFLLSASLISTLLSPAPYYLC